MSQDARYDEEVATQRRAQLLKLDYADTSLVQRPPFFKNLLTKEELYRLKVVPLRVDKNNIIFGITTTTSHQAMKECSRRFQDYLVAFAVISDSGFRDYMRIYDPPKQIVYQDISLNTAGAQELIETVSATLEQVRADDMLAYLVSQAHKLNASDIHVETQIDYVRIRLRIDGVLHPIAHVSFQKYRILVAAIASAGNVSTGVEEAQQGHISEKVKMADGADVDVNIRLETVPTINGMDMVMRLFNMEAKMYNLDRLGLSVEERAVVNDIIDKPFGLAMMVGPTGSGKTTTLYSILNTLNSDERKLITIEDPVEFQFPGITQISVHSQEGGNDNSFANKLRAVLRLDPDIVMVGEIRDMDTARTALQGSLTGHLVLSTFHANNAAAALTRLMDVIGQNPLFVSAIRLVMAQRLVRRLDDAIKVPVPTDPILLGKIQKVVDGLPTTIEKPDLTKLQLFAPGHSVENPYGYSGQLAIREQFRMTGSIRELMQTADRVLSTDDVEAAAVASGMRTMMQDAVLKVIDGQTTMEEVYRVLG